MAIPTNMEMPTYYIFRDVEAGQSFDPTSLIFVPPKDSDELFDALRAKYPHLKSHSERMREAVIEFLLSESQSEQVPVQCPTPQTAVSNMTSPWQPSFQSLSSESSTWSSPELFDLPTPTFGSTPQPQSMPYQYSENTTSVNTPNDASPPALEQMTGVFSLSNSTQPKQRIRRKMTEAEKVEYRKRRIVKACEKCSKRKRKCNHNQPEMENTATTKSNKVSKPANPTSKKPPPLPKIQEQHDTNVHNVLDFSDSFTPDLDTQPLDDFNFMIDDPFPEMSFDNLLSPQSQWPWSDTPDWPLMDTVPNTPNTQDRLDQELAFGLHEQQQQSLLESKLQYGKTPVPRGAHRGSQSSGSLDQQSEGANGNGILWEHLRTGQESPTQKQQATHTSHVHDADCRDSFIFDGGSPSSWNGDQWLKSVSRQIAKDQPSPSGEVEQGIVKQKNGSHVQKNISDKMAAQDLSMTGLKSLSSGTQSAQKTQRDDGNSSPRDESVLQQRQQNTAAKQEQQSRVPSLGEGITSTISPSTELYMLKRRIPKSLHSVVDRNNSSSGSTSGSMPQLEQLLPLQTQTSRQHEREMVNSRNTICTEGNATQVNGGAYQRLDTAKYENPADGRLAGNGSNDGRLSGNDSKYGRLVGHGFGLAAENASAKFGPGEGSTVGKVAGKGIGEFRAGNASATYGFGDTSSALQQGVKEDRLSDHVRRRDHFGRQERESYRQVVLTTIAGILAVFALLSLLSVRNTHSLSLLLMALLSPVPGSKGTHNPKSSHFASELWGTVVSWNVGTDLWSNGEDEGILRWNNKGRCYTAESVQRVVGNVWTGSGKKDGPYGEW